MSRVGVAVVGAGAIGRRHAEVLAEHPAARLSAIVDVTAEAQACAEKAGVPFFSAIGSLFADRRPDGIIIAAPNGLHAEMALAAIGAGVPVLVEKPLADTVVAGLAIVEAAERAGVALLVGHHRRHNPIMERAAALVADGAVGRVLAATAVWLAKKPDAYFEPAWRRAPGAGPILVNAIHDIDCLRMVCGEIETVAAFSAGHARAAPIEDTAAATLRFASGALGTLILSDAAASPYNWEWTSRENPAYPHEPASTFTIAGTGGTLTIPSLELFSQGPADGWFDPLVRTRAHVLPADPYVAQMTNFADVITGRGMPRVSGRDGLGTLAATLAITRSAETGAPVRVADLIAAARSER